MAVLLLDLGLGLALAAAIFCAARRASAARPSPRRRLLGYLLIGLPLPLAVGIEVFAPLRPLLAEATFVAGVAAFAAGALLVLPGDGGSGGDEAPEPETPPWWPEFERDFNAYARGRSRPKVLR